jgi:hypothetical protein
LIDPLRLTIVFPDIGRGRHGKSSIRQESSDSLVEITAPPVIGVSGVDGDSSAVPENSLLSVDGYVDASRIFPYAPQGVTAVGSGWTGRKEKKEEDRSRQQACETFHCSQPLLKFRG